MKRINQVAIAIVLLATVLTTGGIGQILPRFRTKVVRQPAISQACPIGACVTVASPVYAGLVTSLPQGVPAADDVSTEQTAVVADIPQVRMRISGACGSGFAMGADSHFCYYGTNAHVVGTQPGRAVNVDLEVGGQRRTVPGEVVLAMYHSQRIIDFAVVRVPGVTHLSYLPMLKTTPDSQPFRTKGSPRCIWPLEDKAFNNPIISPNSPLIRGLPDAIGGQSGSSIHNSSGATIGVLAWSWGGYCAGQQTMYLWRAASERSLVDIPARPDGLVEVCDADPEQAVYIRPVTEDGIFELPLGALGEVAHEGRAPTEDGIFNLVDSRLADLPIWYTPGGPGPTDPKPDPEPKPDCMEVTAKERALIEFLRGQQAETSRFADFLRGVDWVALMKQIMEIMKLINSLQ